MSRDSSLLACYHQCQEAALVVMRTAPACRLAVKVTLQTHFMNRHLLWFADA